MTATQVALSELTALRELTAALMFEHVIDPHHSNLCKTCKKAYALGIKPDWWKLEGQATNAAWRNIGETITANDPLCRGVMVLGLEAPEEDLGDAFRIARRHAHVKGFAVGRTIFVEPAMAWFADKIDDETAVTAMAGAFGRLCDLWREASPGEV